MPPRDDLKQDLGGILLLFVWGDDLKQDSREILLLFVSDDDLKQDLGGILLLFVSDDDLKQDLGEILLLFVWAHGRRNLFFGAGPEKPNFFCHRNTRARVQHCFLHCSPFTNHRRRYDLKQDLGKIRLLFVCTDNLKQDSREILLLFVSDDDLKQDLGGILLLFVILPEPCWAHGRRNFFSGRGPKNQISSAIATPARLSF